MYSLNVRDHIMIAHSFTGEIFGPARRLHRAIYVVEVEFRHHKMISAEGDAAEVSISMSRQPIEEEYAPMDRMTRDRFPGLHR